MLRNQQVLAERDRQARARVVAEKEQSLVRVRQARERWEIEEQIAKDAARPPRGYGRSGCVKSWRLRAGQPVAVRLLMVRNLNGSAQREVC